MAWTAELLSVEKRDGMSRAVVRYVSDAGDAAIEQEMYADDFDAVRLKEHVYDKLQSLGSHDAAYASLAAMPAGRITPKQRPPSQAP